MIMMTETMFFGDSDSSPALNEDASTSARVRNEDNGGETMCSEASEDYSRSNDLQAELNKEKQEDHQRLGKAGPIPAEYDQDLGTTS